MELEQALGEAPPPEIEVVKTEETGATEEVTAEAETETEESTKVEEPAESPSAEPETPAMVPAAAMHGERDRRQALQKEYEAYKETHPDKEPEPPPSVFEDEKAALDHRDSKLATTLTETLLFEGKGEAVRQYGQEITDEAEQWFIVEAQKSPMLAKQLDGVPLMQQHRTVVDLHQTELKRAEMAENPAEMEARLKQQGIDEYLAQQQTEKDGKKAVIDSIPKSLVGDSSAGTITSSDWSGPTPLESIISDR